MRTCLRRKPLNKVRSFLWSFLLFSAASVAAVEIDQQPLLVAKPVPGNMAIIGSFEFPTMVTRAYKSAYSTSGSYVRSEEHTSELQSRENLVCRLLLEKKK